MAEAAEEIEETQTLDPSRDSAPAAPTLLGASLESVIAQARAKFEASGVTDADVTRHERNQRALALRDFVRALPNGVTGKPEEDIKARVDRRLWAAVSGWQWDHGNVLLLGPTRRGKTTAAAWLVYRLCAQGVSHGGEAFELARMIHFQECRELSVAVREWKLGYGEPEAVTRCKNARLLVLDDWGPTDDKENLERIMHHRYRSAARALPTVFTSGMSRPDLRRTLGDALCARLVECGKRQSVIAEAFGARELNGAFVDRER